MARFGHTITPIGKDKAILFGGAVGDTGTLLFTQANMLSQATLSSATTIKNDGKNSNQKEIHLPTELHTLQSVSTIISLYMEALLEVIFFLLHRRRTCWLTLVHPWFYEHHWQGLLGNQVNKGPLAWSQVWTCHGLPQTVSDRSWRQHRLLSCWRHLENWYFWNLHLGKSQYYFWTVTSSKSLSQRQHLPHRWQS